MSTPQFRIVSATRPKRYFYMRNVDMHLSFDSLHKLANKLLGGSMELGDILICDNPKQDKRKVLQMTKDGFMIYYGRINKGEFRALADHNGRLKNLDKAVLG